jgi:hypothetical protein
LSVDGGDETVMLAGSTYSLDFCRLPSASGPVQWRSRLRENSGGEKVAAMRDEPDHVRDGTGRRWDRPSAGIESPLRRLSWGFIHQLAGFAVHDGAESDHLVHIRPSRSPDDRNVVIAQSQQAANIRSGCLMHDDDCLHGIHVLTSGFR